MKPETIFEVRQLSYAYEGKQTALDEVDLTVEPGESVVILGANGCGKSTLLKILDGLEERSEDYYPFHVARADLLRRSNQREAAAEAYRRAIALCGNPAERTHLQRRLDKLIDTMK